MTEPTEGPGRKQGAKSQSTSSRRDRSRHVRIASAQTLYVVLDMYQDYQRKLEDLVKPATSDAARKIAERIKFGKPISTLYPRLTTPESMVVLRNIWLASDFLTEADRRFLGIHEQYLAQAGRPITRSSLGKALHHWHTAGRHQNPASPARAPNLMACVRSAERIVNAAIVYSLIEPDEFKQQHRKPLRCTARLDELMRTCAPPTLKRLSRLRKRSID